MKNFYEFYRKLNAKKLFEQDGMPLPPMAGQTSGSAAQMPGLGGMGSAPNDMGMPGMPQQPIPGMEGMPQNGATDMEDMENTSPSGEENVDQPEGMDDSTPEGKIMKAVTDIESALSDMKEKGSSGLGDRAETISDLLKMIKKNVEKGSSGDEEEGEAEEGQGPPIGDPALMMGGGGAAPLGGEQDAANMDGAGQSNMPNQASPQAESYYDDDNVLNENETVNAQDTSAIRALWGGYTKDLKDAFRCTKQQEYQKGLFWDIFSHKDASDVRLAVTRNPDDDGDVIEKKYHVAITHYPDEGKEWSTHRYLFPGQNPKSPVNRGNELKFRKGEGSSYDLHPATLPHIVDLQTKDLLKGYKGDISKISMNVLGGEADSSLAEWLDFASYNFKMIQRMEFCGWLPKDYVNASGEFVKQTSATGEDLMYYLDKYTDSKMKAVKENKAKAKKAFIKFVQELIKQSPEIKEAIEALIGSTPAEQTDSFKTLFIKKAGEDKPKAKTIIQVVDMLTKSNPKLKTGVVREALAKMAEKRDYIFKPFEATNAILVADKNSDYAQNYTNPAFEVSSAGEVGGIEPVAPEEPKVSSSMKKKLSGLESAAAADFDFNLSELDNDIINILKSQKLEKANIKPLNGESEGDYFNRISNFVNPETISKLKAAWRQQRKAHDSKIKDAEIKLRSINYAQNLNRESVEMIRNLKRVNINDTNVPGVLRDYWSIRNQMESINGELYNVPKNSRLYETTLIDLEKQLKVGRFTPTNPLDLNLLLKA
jgi:hypothetical protein